MYVQLESIIHVGTKYQISIFYQYKMMDQKLIAFFFSDGSASRIVTHDFGQPYFISW